MTKQLSDPYKPAWPESVAQPQKINEDPDCGDTTCGYGFSDKPAWPESMARLQKTNEKPDWGSSTSSRGFSDKLSGYLLPRALLFLLLLFFNLFQIHPDSVFSQKEHDLPIPEKTIEKLAIITSFPPEFYQPFINLFNKINPLIQVSILNKKTTAALAEIQRGNQRKFDLFWSSSTDAFEVLQQTGRLLQSGFRLQYPSLKINGLNLQNHDGFFYSFALSGVGYMWNNRFLKENQLPTPTGWHSLSDQIYYGQIAMSTPSRSGTTHLIVESILQKMGWQQGWAYLIKASGNFNTITARSFSVPEGIVNGRFGIGLVIDFLAQRQKTLNPDIQFEYGKPVVLIPAGIALLNGAENIGPAEQFLAFVLSPAGQKILLSPAIGRLPVLKNIYSTEKEQIPNLLSYINGNRIQAYNSELSRNRYHLVNQLFDQLITYKLPERRKIWKKLIELQKSPGIKQTIKTKLTEEITTLFSALPVTAEESVDTELNNLLNGNSFRPRESNRRRKLLKNWSDFVSEQLEKADNLLAGSGENQSSLHDQANY
ncbi:ABC transporter substrate-binding protein [Desulfomarina sp.]